MRIIYLDCEEGEHIDCFCKRLLRNSVYHHCTAGGRFHSIAIDVMLEANIYMTWQEVRQPFDKMEAELNGDMLPDLVNESARARMKRLANNILAGRYEQSIRDHKAADSDAPREGKVFCLSRGHLCQLQDQNPTGFRMGYRSFDLFGERRDE